MRDDPYPSRFYPRIEEEPELDAAGASSAALPGFDRDLRRMLSFLLATYVLFALLFALTTQADAAALPQGGDSTAPAAWMAVDESCTGLGKLATQ